MKHTKLCIDEIEFAREQNSPREAECRPSQAVVLRGITSEFGLAHATLTVLIDQLLHIGVFD